MAFRPLVYILVSQDAPRARRAIQSVYIAQQHYADPVDCIVMVNTTDRAFEAQIMTELGSVVWKQASRSNGTAGQGKQACFDDFNSGRPTHSHLILLDGDDYLYPWAFSILAENLNTSSVPIDVLTFHQHDSLDEAGQPQWVDPVPPATQSRFLSQPGADWLFNTDVIWGPGKTLVFSHLATQRLTWATDTIHLWEDTLLLMQSLKQHQEGQLNSVLTLDPDFFFYDRHPHMGSARADPDQVRDNLRERVLAYGLTPETAHLGQLPAIEIDGSESARAEVTALKHQFFARFHDPAAYRHPLTPARLSQAVHEWRDMSMPPLPPEPASTRGSTESTGPPLRRTDVPTQFLYIRQMMRADPARALIELAEAKGFGQATYVDGSPRGNTASYFAQWDQIQDEPALVALFERVRSTAAYAAPFWGIEIYPELLTQIQFSRYQAGDHYGVHVDHDSSLLNLEYDRKLSIYLSLSEGTFEIEGQTLHFGPGDGAVFPAWMAHAAPEQTEGARYSIVAWVPGPPWR